AVVDGRRPRYAGRRRGHADRPRNIIARDRTDLRSEGKAPELAARGDAGPLYRDGPPHGPRRGGETGDARDGGLPGDGEAHEPRRRVYPVLARCRPSRDAARGRHQRRSRDGGEIDLYAVTIRCETSFHEGTKKHEG